MKKQNDSIWEKDFSKKNKKAMGKVWDDDFAKKNKEAVDKLMKEKKYVEIRGIFMTILCFIILVSGFLMIWIPPHAWYPPLITILIGFAGICLYIGDVKIKRTWK